MHINNLYLENFRNYKNLNIAFDPSTNILYGDNAQGKTNILEALFLCGTTKSHRGTKDKDIINFDCDDAHIRTELVKNGISYKIDMHLRKNKTKAIALNGIPIKKASELMGILNIVFFSPEDLSIIKEGPSERRRFIDMELCQIDPFYLHDLSNYNKALNQRNKLLKDSYIYGNISDMLDVWDEQLFLYGCKVIERRKKFIEELDEIIRVIHKNLTGDKEYCHLKYEPDVEVFDFKRLLSEKREKDCKYKTTSIGPHRDDMMFISNDIDIRKFGSQGQQRTAALSLKLSEIELVKNVTGEKPVLLLDDVLSELDTNRQQFLLKSISDIQTIITCTGLDDFINKRFEINRTYHISNGGII